MYQSDPNEPMVKDVVVLTLSSKRKAYCVAGINVHNGEWLRLTTTNITNDGAVEERSTYYHNGEKCRVLDKIRIFVKGENPSPLQPENILLDDARRRLKIEECNLNDVLTIHPIEEHQFLFDNTRPYLTQMEAVALKHSLELVLIENMIIKRPEKTKAEFIYKSKRYENISVTDPRYYSYDDGTYIGDAIIVASIPNKPFILKSRLA